MKIKFGEKLKKLRKEFDLTQEDFANAMGMSFQSVSKWERGDGYPDIELLPIIANYFDVTTDYLLDVDSTHKEVVIKKILDENNRKFNIWLSLCLITSKS